MICATGSPGANLEVVATLSSVEPENARIDIEEQPDGNGRLIRLAGRWKNNSLSAMIKSAGNRISPTEIEEAAVAVPGVAEAVALGIADERLGQAVRLLLRGDDRAIIDAVATHLKTELPNFMQPKDIIVLPEFPRNPNGKIDRVALAQEHGA